MYIPFFTALHIIRVEHLTFWNLTVGKTTGATIISIIQEIWVSQQHQQNQ